MLDLSLMATQYPHMYAQSSFRDPFACFSTFVPQKLSEQLDSASAQRLLSPIRSAVGSVLLLSDLVVS